MGNGVGMTYIEFFDKNAAENLCAALAAPPERVILTGDKLSRLHQYAERYRTILRRRGHEVEFLCRAVNKNSLRGVVEAFEGFVERFGDCFFDLTGGDEIYLAAAGIMAERYRDGRVQLGRVNIATGRIMDCEEDGWPIAPSASVSLSVWENIYLYGGDIVYDTEAPTGTHRWEFTEDLVRDIRTMWQICRRDPRAWNTHVMSLAAANGGSLRAYLPKAKLSGKRGLSDYLKALEQEGLVTLGKRGENTAVTFKNGEIRRCLTTAGLVLELYVYTLAREAAEPDGTLVYHDVLGGVTVDWDGESDGGTENEVDLVMMHGMVPVFVSCKNGAVGMEELYKLNTVATRFGGKYAKRVLVATALGQNGVFDEQFRTRAADMRIRLVTDLARMDGEEALRAVSNFWKS